MAQSPWGVADLDRRGTCAFLTLGELPTESGPIGEARCRVRVCIGRVEVDDEARGELGGAGRRLRPDGEHGNRQGDEGMACDEVEKTGHDRVSSRKL